MKSDIAAIYRSAWAFALACPILFFIPVLAELAQHFVEWQAGMYGGLAGAKAAEVDPLRMQFGYAKTLALLLPGYWFARTILFDGDAARGRRAEWPAIGLWLLLFAIQAAIQWWSLFGPPLADLAGLDGKWRTWAIYGSTLSVAIASIYFTAWFAAWPVGNIQIGPIGSVRIMTGHFWRTALLMISGTLPLMIAHYALSFGAIFAPALLDWPLLLADALVVGMLALTMVGGTTIAARHAASAKGVPLRAE